MRDNLKMAAVAMWCLAVALAVIVVVALWGGCGDTVNNYYLASDTGAEPDGAYNTPDMSADFSEEAFEATIPKGREGWAAGCNPPEWMVNPGRATCFSNRTDYNRWDFAVDCRLIWDELECVASCENENKNDEYYGPEVFENASPEAVSGEYECEPRDEWAPGCNPPEWMVDPGEATCEIDEDFTIGFCLLVWDKSECTASCMDFDPPPYFKNAPPEAVSGELGCKPWKKEPYYAP